MSPRGRWLVDGSNVVGSRPDGWWRDRPAAFARLARELDRFAAATGDELTVVFDGRSPPPGQWGAIDVVAAASADDRMVELVAGDADATSLTAVTSDRELAARLRELGASVAGAGSFRRLLDGGG